MREDIHIFPYTASRGAYLSTIITLLFLLLIEGGAISAIIYFLVQLALLKYSLLGALALFYLVVITIFFMPLWTKHRLTFTALLLHYGLALNIKLDRASIVSAEPIRERLNMVQPLQAQYDEKKQRITAAFSDQGQVLLRLDKPYPLKLGRHTYLTSSLLINVDQPDELLNRLEITGRDRCIVSAKPLPSNHVIMMPHIPEMQKTLGHDISVSTRNADIAVRTEGLTRTFGGVRVVDGLDLAIRQGEIYGFLGSNGAGKTTTIKMLVGLLKPDSGHVWLSGYDMWTEPLAAKAVLGYVADRSILYERLTGREFLSFLAQLREIPRIEAEARITSLLNLLALSERADIPCGSYSFGMKRKLALAGALLHRPSVLILDEPLNGLDPRSTRRLKDLFLELASGGATILLSTHDLATAESVCHRVGILHRGRLRAEGSAEELRRMASAPDLEAVFLNLTDETGEQVEEVQV